MHKDEYCERDRCLLQFLIVSCFLFLSILKADFLKIRFSSSNPFLSFAPMVTIVIAGHSDFPCPVGWTVEEATNEIRSMYGLSNGGIRRNGEAMRPIDAITAGGNYQFVNFQSQQGKV